MRRSIKKSKGRQPSDAVASGSQVATPASSSSATGDSYFWGLRPGRPTPAARPAGWYPSSEGFEDYWDGRSWTARRQAVDGGWLAVSRSGTPSPQRTTTNGAPATADAPPVPTEPVIAPPAADLPRGFPGASPPTRLSPEESYYYGLRPGRPVTTGRPVGWYSSGTNGSVQEDYWDGRAFSARRRLVDGGWVVVPMS
jgi:hypothetical protein